MSRQWTPVTASEPCPICNYDSWCSRSSDGRKVICRRLDRGDGKAKVDKSGMPFWLYCTDGGFEQCTDQAAPLHQSATPKCANDDDLDRVYGALLDRCPLSEAHRENLRSRGLSDEEIHRGRYGSLPVQKRSALAKALLQLFPVELLQRVPGFGSRSGANGAYPTIFGAAGLLVPVRSADGLIVALKVRADYPGDGPKYTYISSGTHGGPGPGARDHNPLDKTKRGSLVRITEGELKADVATSKSDIYTIGVPGIGRFASVLASIPASDEVRLAPDADAVTNPHVARCVLEAIRRARELGLNFVVESWSADAGKGIDDVLKVGGEIRVLRGQELLDYERNLGALIGMAIADGDASQPREDEGPADSSTEDETGISHVEIDKAVRAAIAQAQEHESPRFIYSKPLFDQLAALPAAEAQCALSFIARSLPKVVRGASLRKLLSEAEKRFRKERQKEEQEKVTEQQPGQLDQYLATNRGLALRFWGKDGPVELTLCNFNARIVSEVVKDDGLETKVDFEIEGLICGDEAPHRFFVPADEYADMEWVHAQLGARAIIRVDTRMEQHVRAAIQTISQPRRRIVYTHLGWRQIGTSWFYLHAGGVIGTDGTVGTDTEIDTCLEPALQGFSLPSDVTAEDLRRAVQAMLDLLSVAPDRIMLPLLASVFRAAIGDCDFTVFLAGDSGTFKSTVAALFQAFWGAGFTGANLPCSWLSTANANEGIAFFAKDCLVVVDDFAPRGASQDLQRYHRDADRLLRGQGNRSGRARMRPDGSMRPTRYSRCLFLSTGEDLPSGQSLRARLYAILVRKGDVDVEALTRCQKAARDGVYAQVLAGFLGWMAQSYGEVKDRLAKRSREIREDLASSEIHRRTPTTVAELLAAFEILVDFAFQVGAVDVVTARSLTARCKAALLAGAEEQIGHVEVNEPVSAFLTLLNAAVASGQAHLASLTGEVPVKEGPGALGWRRSNAMPGAVDAWNPQGARVGWIDGDDIYLEFHSAFRAAQVMSSETTRLSIAPDTLKSRLDDRGMLMSRDEARQRFTVRRTIEGTRREVVHIASVHLGLPSQPSQPSHLALPSQTVEPSDPCDLGAPRSELDASADAGHVDGTELPHSPAVPLSAPEPASYPEGLGTECDNEASRRRLEDAFDGVEGWEDAL
jgi:hypothetical protein